MNPAVWALALVAPLVKRILIALGVGLISYGGLALLATHVRDQVLGNLSGLTGEAYQVVAMSGAFEAVGIMLGGLAARAALMAVERFGRVATTP